MQHQAVSDSTSSMTTHNTSSLVSLNPRKSGTVSSPQLVGYTVPHFVAKDAHLMHTWHESKNETNSILINRFEIIFLRLICNILNRLQHL